MPRGGEQGKARCPGRGDVRVSGGAARWHLSLCLGSSAGTAAPAPSPTGVPGQLGERRVRPGELSELLLAAVPTDKSALRAG